MTQISGPYYDPYDIEIDTDPYPTWKRLRDEAPVYHNERYEFYALSRHADVQAAQSDTRRYRSGYGNVLELMGDQPLDVPYLVMQDPPRHDTQRALVSRAFTPRRCLCSQTASGSCVPKCSIIMLVGPGSTICRTSPHSCRHKSSQS